ncbi:hypothetical protein OG453_33620 [Streptomyces sp. NBC_01381]|uniref:hypothetical protein n=1 Tax=Streptomyces sp. NBC_01381 TaxID=2903845 RepID=UPI00224CB3B4|nr:hypothetical protein [Streptomyces sp. NBC_01381]MCX4671572.1 hypothetical protein [Streptomyces sp. NBC_01381]
MTSPEHRPLLDEPEAPDLTLVSCPPCLQQILSGRTCGPNTCSMTSTLAIDGGRLIMGTVEDCPCHCLVRGVESEALQVARAKARRAGGHGFDDPARPVPRSSRSGRHQPRPGMSTGRGSSISGTDQVTMRHMDVWLPAIFGLIGAGIGSGAAMWGVRKTAAVALEQAQRMERHGNRQWVRDRRREAYSTLLDVVDRTIEAEYRLGAMREDVETPPQELLDPVIALVSEIASAKARVDLAGPRSVREAADELDAATSEAISAWAAEGPLTTERIQRAHAAINRQGVAYSAFRNAASVELGFEDESVAT